MTQPLSSVKIRLQGTKDQIDDAVERLSHVFFVSYESKLYNERSDPSGPVKYCYLRVYAYGKDTLLDQLRASQRDLDEAELDNIALLGENRKLRDQLGQLPQPRPDAAVLGTPHHKASNA